MILPSIGASGIWTLKPPFAERLKAGQAYTCEAVRRIREVVAGGTDVYLQFYQRYDIDIEIYKKDVLDNAVIVTLTSSNGQYIFVPSSYITGFPTADGVPYAVVALAVVLGALPNTVDPTFLIEKIKNLVLENIGLDPDISIATVSEVKLKSQEQHSVAEIARNARISDLYTDYTARLIAEEQLVIAQETIASLQAYIQTLRP